MQLTYRVSLHGPSTELDGGAFGAEQRPGAGEEVRSLTSEDVTTTSERASSISNGGTVTLESSNMTQEMTMRR